MNPTFSSTMTTSSLVFNQLLLDKTPVTLILDRGEKLSGQLTGWDEHYLLLVSGSKLQVVPSWRLLWLESDLEQAPAVVDQTHTEPEKAAAVVDPAGDPPQPENTDFIQKEIAAAGPESPVFNAIGITPESPVPDQNTDAPPQTEAVDQSPLDHLEQLVKNW